MQRSQDPQPKPGPVKILAKNQAPPQPLEPQTDKPMDNYEQLKEAGFSEKQSISLANVFGSIRKDIEKLTDYVVERFTAMDTRMDGMDKKIDELKAEMKEGFAASDKRIDNLAKIIMWAAGLIAAMFLGILGLVIQGIYLLAGT